MRNVVSGPSLRLFVVGATGGTGLELVGQALARGHRVTALVRSAALLGMPRERLTVVRGDPLDPEAVRAALVGNDAVLSAMGPRPGGPTAVLETSARALVAAMGQTGARRLLILSVALLFPSPGLIGAVLRKTFLRRVADDSEAMEAIVRATDLDWTIARPPRLTNGPGTESYAASAGQLPPGSGGGTASLRRADLAHFMLDEVERPEFVREVVGLAFARVPIAGGKKPIDSLP